jgi:glycosyltransferase involved in cell wall biosynthesis
MKICFLSSMFGSPWAGSELLWVQTAARAIDDGHEVAVSYRHWPTLPASIAQLEQRGARMFPRKVDLGKRSSRIYERLVHPLPALARWRPDVVCVNLGNFADAMYRTDIQRLMLKLAVPYVVLVHQHYENNWVVPDESTRARTVRFLRAAACVGFVSERNRWAARCQLVDDLPNSRVVRNPISPGEHRPVPWPAPGPARLACVARLDASDKGQDLLMAVLAGERWRSRDWVVRLYGDGRHRAHLEALAEFHGVADRFQFAGHTPDVHAAWADNELLVLPSRCEGTPITLVEAMMWGRPAVVTDVGGNAEWVVEPRNGFVAEASSVRSLDAALERAWQARDRWPALGAQAHLDAMALYDPDPEGTLEGLLLEAGRSGARATSTAPATA